MTTTAALTTAPGQPSRGVESSFALRGATHYFGHTVRLTFRNVAYLIFTIGLPVTMYLVFNSIFGSEPVIPGVNYSAMIMVQMAGYGALGSAMSGAP